MRQLKSQANKITHTYTHKQIQKTKNPKEIGEEEAEEQDKEEEEEEERRMKRKTTLP